MFYVGIDVASCKHDVFIGDSSGKKISYFQISNNKSGIETLLNEINSVKKLLKDNDLRIGLESTGVYSTAILNYLIKENFDVVLINPILTSMYELSNSVHYAKTDKKDAQGICKFLIVNQNIKTYTPISYHNKQLKYLYRELIKLNKNINLSVNRLKGLLQMAFPEFLDYYYMNNLGKLQLTLLKHFPTPNSIKLNSARKISNVVSNTKYVNFSLEDAKRLKDLADSSIGNYDETNDVLISQLTERIELFYKQKEQLIDSISKIVHQNYPNLLKIKGLGEISIAGIVGEIGNINNFKNSDAVVAFAGLNPIVYQSGNYKAQHTRISKRGSSYLRNALITACRSMVMHNEPMMYSYFKKKKENKKFNCAIDHCARKFTNILFTLLKNNIEYNPNFNKQ